MAGTAETRIEAAGISWGGFFGIWLQFQNLKLLNWTIFLTLLLLAPIAMQMVPSDQILLKKSAWNVDPWNDVWFPVKLSLIIAGISGTILAAITYWAILVRPQCGREDRVLHLALLIGTSIIGWRNMPYWALGVFQRNLGHVSWADLDPSALFPLTVPLLEIVWWLNCLLIMFFAPIFLLLLFLHSFTKPYLSPSRAWAIRGLSLFLLLAYFSTPGYGSWFLD